MVRIHKRSSTEGTIYLKFLQIEYNFWSHFCMVSFERGSYDDDYVISLAFPPVVLWFSWGNCYGKSREISLKIHNWCFWWNFWTDDNEWNSKTPKWRRDCFHIDNFLLGKAKYSRKIIEERDVNIPMPEGCYDAHIQLCEDTWTRRWTKKMIRRIDAKIPDGIPHEGKGENSWDCGVDGCFGMCAPARTIAEGVGLIVGSVLHDRVRYGGWGDWDWKKEKLGKAKHENCGMTQSGSVLGS